MISTRQTAHRHPGVERNEEGNYPADSINGRVEISLVAFAINLQGFNIEEEDEENGKRAPSPPAETP